jgi:hypothetical protein
MLIFGVFYVNVATRPAEFFTEFYFLQSDNFYIKPDKGRTAKKNYIEEGR